MSPIGTFLILDIHVNELTAGKTKYLLTSITWLHRGLRIAELAGCAGFRLDHRLMSGYLSGGEGESTCKGKISTQINPYRVVDFSSDIFFAHSSLRKSLIYTAQVISTI